MKPLRVEIFYWDEEEARQAIELEKAINTCCHVPKEVKIIRQRSRSVQEASHD